MSTEPSNPTSIPGGAAGGQGRISHRFVMTDEDRRALVPTFLAEAISRLQAIRLNEVYPGTGRWYAHEAMKKAGEAYTLQTNPDLYGYWGDYDADAMAGYLERAFPRPEWGFDKTPYEPSRPSFLNCTMHEASMTYLRANEFVIAVWNWFLANHPDRLLEVALRLARGAN